MLNKIIIIILFCAGSLAYSDDYVRIGIDVRTTDGKKFDGLYIGAHPDATFKIDYDLGEKEKPPFPPPGNLYCTFMWVDTLAADSFETIHSDEVYFPIPDKKKYHYRYKLHIRKDNSYDTATVRWHNIPEYVDSAYFTDIGEILFKTDMLEQNSYQLTGSALFVDYYYFDVYFSRVPSNVNIENNDNFELYPNPANDILYLNGKYKKSVIYDLSGRIISEKENADYIDISELNPGMYLVKLYDGNYYITKRFIKI